MSYKSLLLTVGTLIAVGTAFFVGCKDESGNKEKYLTYSKYVGITTGYIINTTSLMVGPEVKAAITNVVGTIVTELPTNVTAETIATDLAKIAADAVEAMHVKEQYKDLVDKSVDTLLTLLQVTLTSVKDKHPVEFGNAEMFYNIAYTFFDSVNAVIDGTVARDALDEVPFEIASINYADIKELAKADGNKILTKRDFNSVVEKLNASTK